MLTDSTPQPLPPNKLVKRSSSLASSTGSPFLSSGSKLPLAVFRRPATSHQRSATFQRRHSGTDDSDHMSIDVSPSTARDPQHSLYFAPKVAAGDLAATRRRHSTGIPNPIKRVYPDRKYTPVLMSARGNIRQAGIEMDDGLGVDDESDRGTQFLARPVVASSPLANEVAADGSQIPRRSFSIGDLLSTGPQPLWRRPSQSRGKTSGSRLVRKSRPRVVSAPLETMGSSLSRSDGTDSERPAKRRDLTDPQAGQRSIYTSSSSNPPVKPDANLEIELNLGARTSQSFEETQVIPQFAEPLREATSSPLEAKRLPSANHVSSAAKTARVSIAQSEITVDSDSEYRSIGDGSTDYQSDTVYDSYPTRTTRSSSGRRGPHIETIFDESPPEYSSGRSTRLKDILDNGPVSGIEYAKQYRHSTIEEEGSILSTPQRSLQDKSITSTPSARGGAQQLFLSSPPIVPIMPDPDEIDWDAEDEGDANHMQVQETQFAPNDSWHNEASLPFRFGPALQQSLSASTNGTPHRVFGVTNDKANLFDWSEAQPSPAQNHSPPRPRTVHGKKDPESRGSRSTGRRAPSNMHARSHSVPVVPDAEGKRDNVVANKFGTWGVGHKPVTEDWNEDFDFDDSPDAVPEDVKQDTKRIDSGHAMFVPKSIREQQQNVVANISLLREWGLLIEELKALRIRAVALDMMTGPYAQAFQEVDAMIELADQETEEETLQPRQSPPSSPGFDYNDFDEPMPNIAETVDGEQSFDGSMDATADEDEFDLDTIRPSTPPHIFSGRPRKDSEAVARSVIQALQSKRSVSDPTTLQSGSQAKKVPFDTATLRHIVPYVKDLKRKVKDALRETEGLYMTPRRRRPSLDLSERQDEDDLDFGDEPAFRSIFNGPQANTPKQGLSRREQAVTDHVGSEGIPTDQQGDLAQRMQGMNLPR